MNSVYYKKWKLLEINLEGINRENVGLTRKKAKRKTFFSFFLTENDEGIIISIVSVKQILTVLLCLQAIISKIGRGFYPTRS